MGETLGVSGSLSIALGGMIGGGIFAVLGVVTGITGPLTWLAFVLAVVVVAAELLYFEHDAVESELVAFEHDVEAAIESIDTDREDP